MSIASVFWLAFFVPRLIGLISFVLSVDGYIQSQKWYHRCLKEERENWENRGWQRTTSSVNDLDETLNDANGESSFRPSPVCLKWCRALFAVEQKIIEMTVFLSTAHLRGCQRIMTNCLMLDVEPVFRSRSSLDVLLHFPLYWKHNWVVSCDDDVVIDGHL